MNRILLILLFLLLPAMASGQFGYDSTDGFTEAERAIIDKLAEEPHRSLSDAVFVMNRSVALNLKYDEQRAFSLVHEPIIERNIENGRDWVILHIVELNEELQAAIKEFLGAARFKTLSRAVVQHFFEINRADLAFDWVGKSLTEDQRKSLQDIKLTEAEQKKLAQLEFDFFKELVAEFYSGNVHELFGKAYNFKSTSLLHLSLIHI